MELRDRVAAKRREIQEIAARHGAHNIRLFGSVVRGGESSGSDIDFLVTLDRGRTLFDIARLEEELEALLGCPVDVATEGELAGDVEPAVIRDAREL